MPHSDHHHSTPKHCHHGRKQHRPRDKNSGQPDGWSGKADKGHKDIPVVEPQKPVQIPQIRMWSKWMPGDEERSWFWQARQRENGKWEYQFTKDFTTIYQEERPKIPQPIPYRIPIPPVSTAPAINPYPKTTGGIAPVPPTKPVPAPGLGNGPRTSAPKIVNAETVVSTSSTDTSSAEPPPAPPKPRKEHKHSHQKPHKNSKKIGSVVKADKKVKFDSQSIVENWQVEWPAEN